MKLKLNKPKKQQPQKTTNTAQSQTRMPHSPPNSAFSQKMERWFKDAMDGGARFIERPERLRIDPKPIETQAQRATFETRRLRVFHVPLLLHPAGFVPQTFDESLNTLPRHLFVAFAKEEMQSPRVAATAVIFRYPKGKTEADGVLPMVDWLEVSTECRRKGIGTELIDGIEQYAGWTLDLVDSEPAFEASIERVRENRQRRHHESTPS